MDKPMMKFSLTMPDSDALREMIQRDDQATAADIENAQLAAEKCRSSKLADEERRANAEILGLQRRQHQISRLAEIFSVNLAKR